MDLETAAERLVDSVTRGDLDTMAALYADDAVQHHPLAPAPVVGREAIREAEADLYRMFSDVTVEKRGLCRNGSTVMVEVVLRATNTGPIPMDGEGELPPTNRPVEIPAVWVLELGPDGLITEERDYFDAAALFGQLGIAG